MGTLILSVSGARGLVGDGLDEAVAARLAAALRTVIEPGLIIIGRDSRPSGPALARAAQRALEAAGCRIEQLGIVPTPTVQLAVERRCASGGIVVTASHNPSAWNALKFVGPDGAFLGPESMQRLIAAFERAITPAPASAPAHPPMMAQTPSIAGAPASPAAPSPTTAAGDAAIREHVEAILRDAPIERIREARLRVIVDAVHGAGAVLVGPLLEALGTAVEWIDGEPNGMLPPHPEPRAERLGPLAQCVRERGADLGFALDPDGDRCALTLPGEPLGEEWALPLCAYDRLTAGARGPLVTNWSTSSRVDALARRFGVDLHRTPVGEAHVVARMRSVGALIGGEGNGGVIDPRVHYGRDAGVAITRLLALECAGGGGRGGIAAAAATFPPLVLLKAALALDRGAVDALGARLSGRWRLAAGREDGHRWSWDRAWVHLRPSGTEPIARVFVEAPDAAQAERLLDEVMTEAGKPRRGPAGEGGAA
jgi:phosphomannomutase